MISLHAVVGITTVFVLKFVNNVLKCIMLLSQVLCAAYSVSAQEREISYNLLLGTVLVIAAVFALNDKVLCGISRRLTARKAKHQSMIHTTSAEAYQALRKLKHELRNLRWCPPESLGPDGVKQLPSPTRVPISSSHGLWQQ